MWIKRQKCDSSFELLNYFVNICYSSAILFQLQYVDCSTYYVLEQCNITKDGENKLVMIAMRQLYMQEQSVFYTLWPVIADIMCIILRQIVSANILNS